VEFRALGFIFLGSSRTLSQLMTLIFRMVIALSGGSMAPESGKRRSPLQIIPPVLSLKLAQSKKMGMQQFHCLKISFSSPNKIKIQF
jgi:hypothetical protein